MAISFKFPQIIMELHETDIGKLQKFIANEKIEGEFTEEYLILYNFATDCKYAKVIQPDLIRYLLPFYLKTIEQAIIYENKISAGIYFQFNAAIFFNKKILSMLLEKKISIDILHFILSICSRKLHQCNFLYYSK